jgi:ATP/maltotriose-dependent transcriptional regulator MalT
MASVHYGHATIARLDGHLDEARDAMDRAVELMVNPSFAPQFRATTHSTRGLIEAADGNFALARELHAEALRIALETRDSPVIGLTLVGVADLALREGDPERAAFLLGAADAVRGAPDHSVPDDERVTREARAALGDAGFEAAQRRAAGLTAVTIESAPELDAAPERPDRDRGEDHQQDAGPEQ